MNYHSCTKRAIILILISLLSFQGYARGSVVVIPTTTELINTRNIKENNIVKVLGYYEIDDGGSAEYIISKASTKDSLDERHYVDLDNGLRAVLLKPTNVNYKMFGAKGDGDSNDAVEIAKAHNYANANNLPVVNYSGEYWLKEAIRVYIQTDVDWGNTIFHIEEKYNSRGISRFEVTSREAPKNISLSDKEKKELLSAINSGKTTIPLLEPYKNHLIVIADSEDRVGYRYGKQYSGSSWAKEDLFYVEEAGKIIGGVSWTFENYNKLIAYPVDKNWLNIEGGVFYLSGDSPSKPIAYYRNGFQIRRSRTSISNQWVGMEPGNVDNTTINPRSGFYTFNNVYDVKLENVRLIPYLLIRKSGRNVHSGTYGISMGRVLKSHFKNITAEGSENHWGVFGTNLNKDFKVEDCDLNRVDTHFHCWNLSILNSRIGHGGISITGGGDLIIDNSSCEGYNFVNFRSDYGSRWDGDITITNSTFKATRTNNMIHILTYAPSNFDYGYPVSFGRNIRIENFTIDFNGAKNKDATCLLMRIPSYSSTKLGGSYILPNSIEFKNISVAGREKGVRLFTLANQSGYRVDRKGGYNDGVLTTNTVIKFENIQLEDLSSEEDQFHFSIKAPSKATEDYAFYPSVSFSNCSNIAIRHAGAMANIFIEKSSISNISQANDTPLKGRFVFMNCEFNPVVKNMEEDMYQLDSTVGTFFTNCIVNPPYHLGEERIDLIDNIGFLKINKSVEYNHSNTLLANRIIKFHKEGKKAISTRFLNTLKGNR